MVMYRIGTPHAHGTMQPGSLTRDKDGRPVTTNREALIPLYDIAQRLPDRSIIHMNQISTNTFSSPGNEKIAHTRSCDYFNLPNSPQSGEEIDAFNAVVNYGREPAAPFQIPNLERNRSYFSQDGCDTFAREASHSGFWSSPLTSSDNEAYTQQSADPIHSPSSSDNPGFVFGSAGTIYTPGPSTGSPPHEFGEFFQWPTDLDEGNPIFDLEISGENSLAGSHLGKFEDLMNSRLYSS